MRWCCFIKEDDYYEEKKKWKQLSFGSSGRSKDVDSNEFWDDVAFWVMIIKKKKKDLKH